MSPPTRNGPPPQGPATHKITADQGARDPHQDATAGPSSGSTRVVQVVDHRFSSVVTCSDPAAKRLLRRAATHAGYEQLDEDRVVVYGTRVPSVVAALTAEGYEVQRSTPTTPDATSARTS